MESSWWPFPLNIAIVVSIICLTPAARSNTPQAEEEITPLVTKLEPPNWWTGLTPEVMLILSGRDLDATHVGCNLPTLTVSRTQSSAAGKYLFVWLKIGTETRPGTAVCRITAPKGQTSFELPLAARAPALHRFQGLSNDDVIYLIVPDRFANGDPTNDEPVGAPGSLNRSNPGAYHGGDLAGIKNHLAYLSDLGVTALWLTPIIKNSGVQDDNGYGAVDLFAVDPHFGSLRDYQDLVAAAHEQKIKVFFDAVPSRAGQKHPWFVNPPLPDWFHAKRQHRLDSGSALNSEYQGKLNGQSGATGPLESLVDPHAPESMKRDLIERWLWGALPDLNTENPLVEQYLLQNSIWWAEISGLDGFCLDHFPYVARKFWSDWHVGLRRLYPRLATIGGVFHPDPSVTSFFAGGVRRYDGIDSGLSTLADYPMYLALRDVLLGKSPVGRIADVLRHDSLYPHPEMLVPFFANHDVPRFANTAGNSQTKLKLAFALTLTLRGVPQLYYGDEIGLQGGGDPDNRRDFPGGWRGDSNDAFSQSGRAPEQQEMFSYVRSLLRLRRDHPALRGGRLWHLASDESSYVFLREAEEEQLIVVFNNAGQLRELRFPVAETPAQKASGLSILFGSASADLAGREIRFKIPAESVSIFALN